MSQTIDMPNYTIELSDGLIRPMTVKELAVRLEQMMAADKGIAGMPVGLSVDSEGRCGRCYCRRGSRLLWCSRVRSDRVEHFFCEGMV